MNPQIPGQDPFHSAPPRFASRKWLLKLADLARIYGVSTGRFNEAVKRDLKRFPEDFSFVLTREEYASLKSQIAILKAGRGQHRKYLPRAFTEQGALMRPAC